ncbi:MAG: NTP transferase domain-containing protein [Planctomycetota bacterium]|nr:NTP transferase domain-containing protein [Planctomycetota bacterium]
MTGREVDSVPGDPPAPRGIATAVVIGRAGSRGLPGKNALCVAGEPMIARSVGHAHDARSIGRILCSTDGAEIAAAARAAGAEIVNRPAALADDQATVDAAVRHAVEATADRAAVVVVLYGNIPIRPEGLLDRAVDRLLATGADSVQSYSPVGKHHPYWTCRIDDEARVSAWEENTIHRRQDLPSAHVPDGGVIAVTRESLFRVEAGRPHAFLGTDRRAVFNDAGSVVDVDDEIDLLVAEAMLKRGTDPKQGGPISGGPS